jgi:hypothetical protein
MSLITEEKKKRWLALSEQKLQEVKDDMSTTEGWTLLKEDSGMSGYSADVPNDANKKVKGGGPIKTNMTPKQFTEWIDGIYSKSNINYFRSKCRSH